MTHAFLRPLWAAFAATIAVATPPSPCQTQLELGKMWTFENPPLAYLEQEYGFKPTQEWLEALRLGALRFGGWCSASFVSPKGLIMTNHHCVRDNIAQVSSPEDDWVKNGFYAADYADEVRLEGLTVQQLVGTRDVTAEMFAGIEPTDDDLTSERKREENESRILADAQKTHPNQMAQVVKLHQGAQFALYTYKVYDDVRLVCAPHLQSAHFGGDPDNFTYPRYCLDFAFCRAYEDGQPADTSRHYFRWSVGGAKDSELVFVVGNPGETGRLLTYAQMEFLRDAEYPIVLDMLKNRLAVLKKVVEQTPALEQRLRTVILGDENSVKAVEGYFSGLLDPKLMEHKRKFEADFRQRVAADPKLQTEYGGVWDRLQEICAQKTSLEGKRVFHVPGYSSQIERALALVRATEPGLAEEERQARKELVLDSDIRSAPLYDALLVDQLVRTKKVLGADDAYVKAVLGDLEPAEAARRLAKSKVNRRQFCEELLDGGREAVDQCEDVAVVAARVLDPLIQQHEQQHEKLRAAEAVQARLVGRALFAVYGDKISPDATMTLRFTDGLVKCYPYNGTLAPYRTTFYGLYARHAEFDGVEPFDIPEPWLVKRSEIDLAKPLNFVSTNDIIGGNSGSPVVNKELEVVGLIFDGNIEQLPNNFLYRDRVERSVSVHADAILEAMTKVYGATRVVEELTGAGR